MVTATACEAALDIVMVVDSSGSIRDNNPTDGSYDNWALLLDFLVDIVNRFRIGPDYTQIGLVVYSEYAFNQFYLNTYQDKDSMINAIRSMRYLGSFTNTSGGLRKMHSEQFTFERGDRSNRENIAIVITDGVSNREAENTITEAEKAHNKSIKIFSLGITNSIDRNEVRRISSLPQELNRNYFFAESFQQSALSNVLVQVSEQSCLVASTPRPTTTTPPPGN